jgi:hypothetical protein
MTLLTPPERPASGPGAVPLPAEPGAPHQRFECMDGNEAASLVA